jgi:hypothetical protein
MRDYNNTFIKRQLELYPLEMFSETKETLYTPTIGKKLKFRPKPAMNKGTAVFNSGFCRDGICENVDRFVPRKDFCNQGYQF